MKKLYFLFTAFIGIASLNLNAQLTLTKLINEPVTGNTYTNVAYDSVALIPKSTGTAQVWDFSAATKRTGTNVETRYSFTTAAAVSSSSNYAGCNLVEVGNSGSINTYYKTTPTQFELLGQLFSGGGFNFSNSAVVAVWPIAFGYNVTDPIAGTFNVGAISANATGNQTVSASGSGTLILPGGITLSNVLQLRATQNLTATVPIPIFPITATINATSFQYYHASEKFPILTVNYQRISLSSGSPSVTASMVINANAIPIGLNEYNLSASDVQLYPNPATNLVMLEFTNPLINAFELEVYNQLGQLLHRKAYTNTNQASCPLNELSTGIYFFKLKTNQGVLTKKVVKH